MSDYLKFEPVDELTRHHEKLMKLKEAADAQRVLEEGQAYEDFYADLPDDS